MGASMPSFYKILHKNLNLLRAYGTMRAINTCYHTACGWKQACNHLITNHPVAYVGLVDG